MTAADTGALGALPGGAPDWLVAVYGIVAVLVALFGRNFGASIVATVKNRRAGLAARETEARQQERQFRATERTAAEQETDRVIARMSRQLEQLDADRQTMAREVEELREHVRGLYRREQDTMANLFAHGVWDHATKQHLPEDFPPPPPLMPPRRPEDQRSVEWGHTPA